MLRYLQMFTSLAAGRSGAFPVPSPAETAVRNPVSGQKAHHGGAVPDLFPTTCEKVEQGTTAPAALRSLQCDPAGRRAGESHAAGLDQQSSAAPGLSLRRCGAERLLCGKCLGHNRVASQPLHQGESLERNGLSTIPKIMDT